MKRLMLAALAAGMIVNGNVFAGTKVEIGIGIGAAALLNVAALGAALIGWDSMIEDQHNSVVGNFAKGLNVCCASLLSTSGVALLGTIGGAVVTLQSKGPRAAAFTAANALISVPLCLLTYAFVSDLCNALRIR